MIASPGDGDQQRQNSSEHMLKTSPMPREVINITRKEEKKSRGKNCGK